MKRNLGKVALSDIFGITLLVTLTIFVGYMGCNHRFSKNQPVTPEHNINTTSKDYNIDYNINSLEPEIEYDIEEYQTNPIEFKNSCFSSF